MGGLVEQYLKRIGYKGQPDISSETLKKLTLLHTLTIPFETIDLVLGIRLSLETNDIFEKIVVRGRGGCCYELNLLFGALLTRLGFKTEFSLAHLLTADGELRRNSVHLIIRVHLEETWLVDVSWGKGLMYPLPLKDDKEEQQFLNRYKCIQIPHAIEVWEKQFVGDWRQIYFVVEGPLDMALVERQTDFHQYNPESEFYKRLVLVLAREDGFDFLKDNKLTRRFGAREETLAIESKQDLEKALTLFQLERFVESLWKGG